MLDALRASADHSIGKINMSKPRRKSVTVPLASGQTKTLIAEHPGTTALLLDGPSQTPMTFPSAHAALDWCEQKFHRVLLSAARECLRKLACMNVFLLLVFRYETPHTYWIRAKIFRIHQIVRGQ
jgi:hypothetical protein